MKNRQEAVAKILLKLKAVSLRPNKPFRYSSGMLSPVYTDCRLLISSPQNRKKIIDYYLNAIKEEAGKFDVVAGTSTAGIPHAAWIADALNLPMIYVRSSAKDHGKGNQIEGKISKGERAIVIEDLISTGSSSIETVTAIRKTGAKADIVFSIIAYTMKKAIDNFKENKIKLISLASFSDIVNTAEEIGIINNKDKNVILQWVKDPASWGKKMGFEKI